MPSKTKKSPLKKSSKTNSQKPFLSRIKTGESVKFRQVKAPMLRSSNDEVLIGQVMSATTTTIRVQLNAWKINFSRHTGLGTDPITHLMFELISEN